MNSKAVKSKFDEISELIFNRAKVLPKAMAGLVMINDHGDMTLADPLALWSPYLAASKDQASSPATVCEIDLYCS